MKKALLRMKRQNQRGVSLIEIMSAISLASIIGVLLIQVIVQNSLLLSTQSAAVNLGLSLNQANALLSADIKNTKTLSSSKLISGSTYNTSTSSVILNLPSLQADGDNSETNIDYVVISRDATKSNILRRWVIPDATASTLKKENLALSTNLSSITFTYYDSSGLVITNPANFILAAKIQYTINVLTKLGSKTRQDTISNTVSLRNN